MTRLAVVGLGGAPRAWAGARGRRHRPGAQSLVGGVNTRVAPPARQQMVRVTEGVVARSMAFEFLVPIVGLGVVPRAGTPIARDGDHTWFAPYDNTVLVMPGLAHLAPGCTVVRLGRFDCCRPLLSTARVIGSTGTGDTVLRM